MVSVRAPIGFLSHVPQEKVKLVAQLLKKKLASLPHMRYVMVSHRPEMYAYSDQIAGVYSWKGSSRIVTQVFRDVPSGESSGLASPAPRSAGGEASSPPPPPPSLLLSPPTPRSERSSG